VNLESAYIRSYASHVSSAFHHQKIATCVRKAGIFYNTDASIPRPRTCGDSFGLPSIDARPINLALSQRSTSNLFSKASRSTKESRDGPRAL
jgi:hypothetical protein